MTLRYPVRLKGRVAVVFDDGSLADVDIDSVVNNRGQPWNLVGVEMASAIDTTDGRLTGRKLRLEITRP